MTLIKLRDYFGFSIYEILRKDKKVVKRDLKPVYRSLPLISVILLIIELLDLFSVIKLVGWLGWFIWGIFLLSIHTLALLNRFDASSNTVGFKYTWQSKLKVLLHL